MTQFTSDAPVDINAHSEDEVEPVMQARPSSHVPMMKKKSAAASLANSAMRFAQSAVHTAEELAAYGQMFIRGNGCGTDATAKYIPQGNMLPACNNHDACYENCNDTKTNCDNKFASDMKAICASKYKGFTKSIQRGLCYVQAGIYYLAVKDLGMQAYVNSMHQHCPGRRV